MHGFKVITTCSPKHFDALRALGADEVFDYESDVVDDIMAAAPDLKYFFDTIGNENSTRLGAQTLSDPNSVMCTVRPNKAHTDNLAANVRVTAVLMWTAFGEDLDFRGIHFPVSVSKVLVYVYVNNDRPTRGTMSLLASSVRIFHGT